MNILITGAAGFIGFHLFQKLQQAGIQAFGIDHFNDQAPLKIQIARAQVLHDLGCEVIQADVNDVVFMDHLFQKRKISHVIHLAAKAGIRYSQRHPQSTVHSNVTGFLNLLELLRKHRHIPLIYASSSSVYGLKTKVPFSEDDEIQTPAHLYGVTKQTNELMAKAYHHLYGIKTVGLRFFTVYGPWGRPDMAYYTFTDKMIRQEPLQLYHEGKLKRDFTYIDDIIEGIMSALNPQFDCEIFNLGHQQPQTVLTLVSLLEQKLGKQAIKQLLPEEKGEVLITYADLSKSQKYLNYSPKVSLSEGLDSFLAWYLNYHQHG
ncbi:MAG: NAD-dependent epimerase/dehydratase family protein [Candidatus Rhabdochlamydia sp.]